MKYKITIRDDFFSVDLTGEFAADDGDAAIAMCTEHYAHELDTYADAIAVIAVAEVEG